MMTKHIILVVTGILCISSCQTGKGINNPKSNAILNTILDKYENIKELSFYDFKITDSVTYRQQFEIALSNFQKKRNHIDSYANRYQKNGKRANAKHWREMCEHTDSIILSVNNLYNELSNKKDSVLYYICTFSGNGRSVDGALVIFDKWYATIDKKLKTYNIQKDCFKIEQGMGLAIPGFGQIVKEETEIETNINE